jgi:hypothetical protein
MKHIRWYDKNLNLKELFKFIEELDDFHQSKIAEDILQMLMCDFNLDLDTKINEITEKYDFDCKRWYDHNPDLFTSFAIIKDFSPHFQQEVIGKIVKSILHIYIEEKEKM